MENNTNKKILKNYFLFSNVCSNIRLGTHNMITHHTNKSVSIFQEYVNLYWTKPLKKLDLGIENIIILDYTYYEKKN